MLELEIKINVYIYKSELQGKRFTEMLEQRGLATNGAASELQSRLREAMEAENINVDEYVFQLELEEETTKIEENQDVP